ncbi:hypothetical protein KEM09_02565 [Carboxylicivirga mesophila]|uniref:PilZ domain-containing protein n=1 Tax=Carboxylicivirga mesophila TaxID=1166478 RepID=A0ABS5K5N6_9BACT|nr:hypothetical protein [Carboxylicivirga mesophila]MBS2210262.1 hypothetical protein [Carboxylicivirga mesophila]
MKFKTTIEQNKKTIRKISFNIKKDDKVLIEKNSTFRLKSPCGVTLKVLNMRVFHHLKNGKKQFLFGVAENLIEEDERLYDGRKLISSSIRIKPDTDFHNLEKMGIITEKLPAHKLFKI